MKQPITLDIDLKDFLIKNSKEDIILINRKGKWQGISKTELLKEKEKEIQDLKDQVESFKLDNIEMKNQIKKFKEALLEYGFNLMKGGNYYE